MAPPHTQTFEDAVRVTPVSSHEYTANLQSDWAIGAGTFITLYVFLLSLQSTMVYDNC